MKRLFSTLAAAAVVTACSTPQTPGVVLLGNDLPDVVSTPVLPANTGIDGFPATPSAPAATGTPQLPAAPAAVTVRTGKRPTGRATRTHQ